MKVSMPRWIGLGLFVFASLGISICSLRAEETGAQGNDGLSVTVAFGSGLNTLGAANHHVLPPEIKVRQDGVVHFLVSGFHMAVVYKPGTEPEDIGHAYGTFILDPTKLHQQKSFTSGSIRKVGHSARRRPPIPSMVPIGKSQSLSQNRGLIW